MFNKVGLIVLFTVFVTGCASIPMESQETSNQAKRFLPPQEGKVGLYIYRSGAFGAALKKDIWVNGKCIGESASNIFFYEEVSENEEHTIATESEFSLNEIKLAVTSGINYFIRQYIKMGLFVGGANLEVVNDFEGKEAISNLQMAQKGKCGG